MCDIKQNDWFISKKIVANEIISWLKKFKITCIFCISAFIIIFGIGSIAQSFRGIMVVSVIGLCMPVYVLSIINKEITRLKGVYNL